MIKRNRPADRRNRLREKLWPSSAEEIWRSSDEKGFFCPPRTLPLLMRLLHEKRIFNGKDCGPVYLELLSRDFGQGIVEITSEDEHAYFAGYSGSRASRSWRERVRELERAGFIRLRPKPHAPQGIGYVLIRHPHLVVSELQQQGLVDKGWKDVYQKLFEEIGAAASAPARQKGPLRAVEGGKKKIGGKKVRASRPVSS